MRTKGLLTVWFVLAVSALTSQIYAQDRPRGWAITWADGRTTTTPLRPKAGMWTPRFPRVPGAEVVRNGRPLYVIDVSYVAEGDDVVATVTLVYGRFEDRVKVAEVRVSARRSVVVEELRSYGVEPVTLAIVPLEPSLALPFIAEEPSGQLEVHVEVTSVDTPLFRIVVRNHSARDLRAIDYVIYQGEARLATGRRKEERNEPLVRAGSEYAFDYSVSRPGNGVVPMPERLVVTSVMWDDGSVDGDHAPAIQERDMALKRARQLEQLLVALDDNKPVHVEPVRLAFVTLDRSDYALEHLRSAALIALDKYTREPDSSSFGRWTASTRADIAEWLARVRHAVE